MYNLVLGMGERGDEWVFERIGTEREKLVVEKELQDLRERLSQVEEWKARHEAIEKELARVWVEGGTDLDPPPYVQLADTETAAETTAAKVDASEPVSRL